MKAHLYRWHRRLALLVLVPLLIWALSGLLHPTMRLTRPEPAAMFYPPASWDAGTAALDSGTLLRSASIDELANLKPVQLAGHWYLQVTPTDKGPAFLLDPQGQRLPQGAQRYAEQLARHFAGDRTSAIRNVEFIDRFSASYPAVNRLLPVWKVQFERDDQLSVFVDIRHQRLGALSDTGRETLLSLFQLTHTWSFLAADSLIRHGLIIFFMAASTVVGITGLYLFIWLPVRNRKGWPVQKLHSYSGLAISIFLLMFVISGLLRTVEKVIPDPRGQQQREVFHTSSLQLSLAMLVQRYPQASGMNLHRLDGFTAVQLLRPRQPALWIDAETLTEIADGEQRYARQLAAQLYPQLATDAEMKLSRVTHFRDHADYGFIDKRLPVMAVEAGATSLFIDTRDAVLARKMDGLDRATRWSFRYLHKWRFADALGKNPRDLLISLCILLISASALMGGWIWLRRQRKRRQALQPHQPADNRQ